MDELELTSSETRYERLRGIALAMSSGETDSAWLADRLSEIPASYEEFSKVLSDVGRSWHSAESALLAAIESEKSAVASVDQMLSALSGDIDFASVSQLSGMDEGYLRRRAGAPVDGKSVRVGVKNGLPMTAAAKTLGISRSTLYKWIDTGKIDRVMVDGRKLIATDANGKVIMR